jgi:hypothetical protein
MILKSQSSAQTWVDGEDLASAFERRFFSILEEKAEAKELTVVRA